MKSECHTCAFCFYTFEESLAGLPKNIVFVCAPDGIVTRCTLSRRCKHFKKDDTFNNPLYTETFHIRRSLKVRDVS